MGSNEGIDAVTRKPAPPTFLCPLCGLRSYHPRDLAERYCARCGFVDDVAAERASRDKWEDAR